MREALEYLAPDVFAVIVVDDQGAGKAKTGVAVATDATLVCGVG